MRAALAYLAERAGSRRRVAILGDMAELGPGAPGLPPARSAPRLPDDGVHALVAVGELARGYLEGAAGVPVTRWYPDAAAATAAVDEVVEPGDCVLVKALACRRARGRRGSSGGGARVIRVLIAGVIALVLSTLLGPRFIAFLRRNEFGQQIREEGPERHVVKQGTPTLGGLLILMAGSLGVPRGEQVHGSRPERVLRDARLRRDRVPRRLHQADAQALARAERPLEAPAPRRDHGRRRDRRATSESPDGGLHPGDRGPRSSGTRGTDCSSS